MALKNTPGKNRSAKQWLRSGITFATVFAVMGHCADMALRIRKARDLWLQCAATG